jgi:ribosome-binding protein aMBF1 (putative translation factor)
MKCEFCERDAPALITLRVYTRQGIKVCEECYRIIDSHRHKPYSKIIDKLAIAEASYYVNRKLAKDGYYARRR